MNRDQRTPSRLSTDAGNLAIGVLTTTAVILLVGLMLVGTRPPAAWGSGMTASGGDYVLTVGQSPSVDEELLYVIDGPSERLVAYRFDAARPEIQIVQGLDLAELRSDAAPGKQPPDRQRGGRGGRRAP